MTFSWIGLQPGRRFIRIAARSICSKLSNARSGTSSTPGRQRNTRCCPWRSLPHCTQASPSPEPPVSFRERACACPRHRLRLKRASVLSFLAFPFGAGFGALLDRFLPIRARLRLARIIEQDIRRARTQSPADFVQRLDRRVVLLLILDGVKRARCNSGRLRKGFICKLLAVLCFVHLHCMPESDYNHFTYLR